MVKNLPVMQETQVWSLGWEDPWRRKWQPTPVFLPGNFMDRGPWRATVRGVAEQWHDQATNMILVEIRGNEYKATSTVQAWWLVRNRGRALALLVWSLDQFSSVQSLSRVRLFTTPWIAARQASLSITNSRSSLRLTSIKSVLEFGSVSHNNVRLFLPRLSEQAALWFGSCEPTFLSSSMIGILGSQW